MKAKKSMYKNGGKAPIVPDPKKKVVIETLYFCNIAACLKNE